MQWKITQFIIEDGLGIYEVKKSIFLIFGCRVADWALQQLYPLIQFGI